MGSDEYEEDNDTYDPLEDLADKLYPYAMEHNKSLRILEEKRNGGLGKKMTKNDEQKSSTTRPYQLIAPDHGRPFLECYARAHREGLPILSHKKLDDLLMGKDTRMHLPGYSFDYLYTKYAYWSGTFVATSGTNTSLPSNIEYIDPDSGRKWTFPVPSSYQGRRDAYLFIDPLFYSLVTDRFSARVCLDTAKVRCLQIKAHDNGEYYGTITQDSKEMRIPVDDFRHVTEEETLHGYERVHNNPWRRVLWTPHGSHVGPIFRPNQTHPLERKEFVTDRYGNVSDETKCYREDFSDWVELGISPSKMGGVIVEVPD